MVDAFGEKEIVLGILGPGGGLPASEGFMALVGGTGRDDIVGLGAAARDEDIGAHLARSEVWFAVGFEEV